MATKKKSKLARLPRSRGAVELVRTGLTQEEIAAKLGRPRQAVQRWMAGSRIPNDANRDHIAAVLGVEPTAWDENAHEVRSPPKEETKPFDPSMTPREQATELQRRVHQLLVDADGQASTLQERARILGHASRTLESVGKITGDMHEISEARGLRMPSIRRVLDTVAEALKEHPNAAHEVALALEALEA